MNLQSVVIFDELAICGNISIYFWLNVNLGMAESSVPKGPSKNKRSWTANEDERLIDALMELHVSGKYSGADNGFKPGYFKAVQQLLDVSLPNSGLKAEPHIKSRLKTLKSNFSIVHDMLLGTDTSGFSFKWDSETCCVDAEDKVWTDYCKVLLFVSY